MIRIIQGQEMQREDLQELSRIGAVMESTGIPADGEYKDYFFEVDENYKVTILGKLKGEKPSIQAEILTIGVIEEGGTVEIKVTANITEGSIASIEATNGATLKTDTSALEKTFEVNANGIYYFKAKADNGRSTIISIVVNTILEKLTIEIKDIGKTEFTIAVTNNYAHGIITEYKYYVDGIVTSEGTTNTEYVVTGLTAETEYTDIYVEAYAGETKLTSNIANIETESAYYSWEELAKIAKAISDNDETITSETLEATVTIDGIDYTVKVGDTRTVTYSGTKKQVRIIGFNHDTLADQSAYGGKNTYAGISFEFVDIITTASMNTTNTSEGGWGATKLRETLNNTIINNLSNNLYIKQVNKNYISIYNDASSIVTSKDKLWILGCSEIWNNGYKTGGYGRAITKDGEQYKYYKDINATCTTENSKLIKNSTIWWLRSPNYTGSGGFCDVRKDGLGYSSFGSSECGVAPGFAI